LLEYRSSMKSLNACSQAVDPFPVVGSACLDLKTLADETHPRSCLGPETGQLSPVITLLIIPKSTLWTQKRELHLEASGAKVVATSNGNWKVSTTTG
jgi:hypothetical protein